MTQLIAKCFVCGKRFWRKPLPSKCDKCGGATVPDIDQGVY